MAQVKVGEISGAALDWAVAKCEGRTIRHNPMGVCSSNFYIWEETPSGRGGILIEKSVYMKIGTQYSPVSNWSLGGPIIKRESISICPTWSTGKGAWKAFKATRFDYCENPIEQCAHNAKTPLIAAMRCYVASKLGDTVDIPDELKGY